MLIDTHCHLNDRKAFPDPKAAIQEAIDAGVERLIVVAVDEEWSEIAVSLADEFESVYAVVGHHPTSTDTFTDASLKLYEKLWTHPKVVGIGEIGLDYHWKNVDPLVQLRAYQSQAKLAISLGAPIVIHCREAYDDLLAAAAQFPRHKFLLHCFGGDQKQAQKALDLGAMFGVDGPLTYAKAEDLRALFKWLPRDRVVIETDAPWLTPHPFRGNPNRPALVKLVAEKLAEIWGLTIEETAAITTANARGFFSKLN